MLTFVLFSPPISRIFAGTFDGVLVPDVVDAALCVGGDQSPLFLALLVALLRILPLAAKCSPPCLEH